MVTRGDAPGGDLFMTYGVMGKFTTSLIESKGTTLIDYISQVDSCNLK